MFSEDLVEMEMAPDVCACAYTKILGAERQPNDGVYPDI